MNRQDRNATVPSASDRIGVTNPITAPHETEIPVHLASTFNRKSEGDPRRRTYVALASHRRKITTATKDNAVDNLTSDLARQRRGRSTPLRRSR
jgi:hypothetical protein